MRDVNARGVRRRRGFSGWVSTTYSPGAHTMADLAFAATTVAVFALLSLVARGMDRL
ncbi:hypothetical protein IHE61_28365 [Streptomyces sp. GKU 257-1]|nr:hypothetical protein [Streptomyces sp. GKU 257-1]